MFHTSLRVLMPPGEDRVVVYWRVVSHDTGFTKRKPFIIRGSCKISQRRLWCYDCWITSTLRWRHNERDSVSNHQPHDCILNRLFRRRSKKTSKLRVTGLCAGNSPGTGVFPAQMASNAENVSIWWRHHETKNWKKKIDLKRDVERHLTPRRRIA